MDRMVIIRGVLVLLVLVWAGTAAATVIPSEDASKPNRLGYKSRCSYTPISTVILAGLAIIGALSGYRFGVF